ncbi:MAG: hypothetical protein FJ264_03935 [Planctomycetes bacterium]|nr:hypothetical protein [Planctomycetota bacterium]
MKMPHNTKLPFFSYGIFKPQQLCYFRIRDMVKSTRDVEVDGMLKAREGIPMLVLSQGTKTKGVLIQFTEGKETEAYKRITEAEPDEVYCWGEVIATNNVSANTLIGKVTDKDNSDLEEYIEWDGEPDPYFNEALEEIEEIIYNIRLERNYKTFFHLQMAYFLLWNGLERYANLRYHLGKNIHEKVLQIAQEKAFAESLKKHVKGKREIYSLADISKYILDPNNPEKSIQYYSQIRSITLNRGKAFLQDFEIMKYSLIELLEIFKDLLKDASK